MPQAHMGSGKYTYLETSSTHPYLKLPTREPRKYNLLGFSGVLGFERG
jgi:hypothetical protein